MYKRQQIVGVENDVLFQLMDGIANAVSDSCVPQIIPDIEPQTVDVYTRQATGMLQRMGYSKVNNIRGIAAYSVKVEK